jgi:hypothetical protein
MLLVGRIESSRLGGDYQAEKQQQHCLPDPRSCTASHVRSSILPIAAEIPLASESGPFAAESLPFIVATDAPRILRPRRPGDDQTDSGVISTTSLMRANGMRARCLASSTRTAAGRPAEFDFRYNAREVSDVERRNAVKQVGGQRLMCQDSCGRRSDNVNS